MMRYLNYAAWAIVAIVVVLVGHYTLPQNDVVRIVNADVRRVDLDESMSWFWSRADTGTVQTNSRDVRFIETIRPDGEPMVYRNEDTGWTWPPYLKFDSTNLQARAQDLRSTRESPRWVAIRHYGWRSDLFSIYPNAVDVTPVDGPDATVFPWRMVIALVSILIGVIAIAALLRLFRISVMQPLGARVRSWFS